MTDPRRYLGSFAIAALVLLRLVIGWHFFTQGTEKIAYDERTGRVRMTFSAGSFLAQAKGPLSDVYRSQAPDGHDWPTLLAVPRENAPLSAEEAAARARWVADYPKHRAEAEKNKAEVPSEFPPFAPYHDWATRIAEDWQAVLAKATAIAGLSDEQKSRLAAAYAARKRELADYLAGESEAITEYQHQLWRLANWKGAPEADSLPFQQQRIASKNTETARSSQPWISHVAEFERLFIDDVSGVLTPEQLADAKTADAMVEARTSSSEKRLHYLNIAVTALTIGVGICLLLGLFTRLASIVGALFLLSVIASQPPWIADAASTINQAIELAGLLVLAGTGAGRWLGLDFFTYALFGRSRGDEA